MLRVFKTYHTGAFTVMFSSYPGLLSSTGALATARLRLVQQPCHDRLTVVPCVCCAWIWYAFR